MKSFSELSSREKTTEVLRWVGVPVAAVLAVSALHTVAGLVVSPALVELTSSTTTSVSDIGRTLFRAVFGPLTAALFVVAGVKTAPRCRGRAAIVLAGLWCLSAAMSHVLLPPSRGIRNYVDFLAEALAAAAVALAFGYSSWFSDWRR